MPVPDDQRFRFFVYVIESPSDIDLYDRRSEGEAIKNVAALSNTPCEIRTVISKASFVRALNVGMPTATQGLLGLTPILHISAHGNQNCIGFSNGESMDWDELSALLRPVNDALKGNLVVCMSSCQGYFGSKMAMEVDTPNPPFLVLIGNYSSPNWSDTTIAYATFYHQITRGEYIGDAVGAMKTASGNADFGYWHGADIRAHWQRNLDAAGTEPVSNIQQ